MELTVKVDDASYREAEKLLAGITGGIGRAASAAVNRGADHGRTQIGRGIRESVNISQRETLRAVVVRHGSADHPQAYINISRKPRKLIAYRPTQTAEGVRVEVRPGQVEIMPHAFIATMKSGHVGVFVRAKEGAVRKMKEGKRGKQVQGGQGPIYEKYGPTVVGVLAGKPGLMEQIEVAVQNTVAKRFQSQIDRLLAGK